MIDEKDIGTLGPAHDPGRPRSIIIFPGASRGV